MTSLRSRLLQLTAFSLPLFFITSLQAFDLNSYRESRQISVGVLNVEVLPARSLRLKSPSGGSLHLHQPERPGIPLAAGTLWGEFDPERTKLEREAITLARTLLEKKQQPKAALDLAREAAELVERRSELVRQSGMLQRIIAEPELAQLYLEDNRADSATNPTEEITALLARLKTQTELIDAVLAFSGSDEDFQIEARVLELKLIQQELDLKDRESEKRLTMPFDGELTLLPRRPSGDKPLRIQLGEDLALIQDFSIIRARLVMKRPEWRLIPTGQLFLRINAGVRPLVARFDRSLLEEVNGREELVYYFNFAEADRPSARSLIGGGLTARLYAELPQPARIVPKLDLVIAHPDAFREGDWTAGLSAALPESQLMVIGDTELAITPSGKKTAP